MQYRLAILAFAGLAAAQASTSSAAGAQSTSGVTPQQSQCLSACAAGDVNCQAQCVNVPFPNESQVNANTQCARNCNQGNGSPEQTEAFGKCLAQCASQYYFSSGGTVAAGAAPTAAPASGAAGGSGSNASSTGTGAAAANTGASMSAGSGMSGGNSQSSGTGASGAQNTGSNTSSRASSTSNSGAAATLMPVGMMGVAMAVLAL